MDESGRPQPGSGTTDDHRAARPGPTPPPPASANDPARANSVPHTPRDPEEPPHEEHPEDAGPADQGDASDTSPGSDPFTERTPAGGDDTVPPAQDPVSQGDTPATRTPATSGRRPTKAPEPRSGLLMGRPFGVPVYVAPSWFLVAALITWVFGGQLDHVLPGLGAVRYLVSLFFAVAFYASVLVHELAHTVAALRFKLPVRRIQLQFFGGVSEIEKESETPGREFVLAFVGPLLSLVLAGVFYLGMLAVEPGTVPGVLLAGLMISNLIVAAFNLLPGLPLDGGRMLRAIVWKITGKPMSGTVAAAWVGRALAITVLIGLPLLTQSGALGEGAADVSGMDTVTDALLAAILAAIIWTGAGNSLRMARLREHLPELRARTLTRRAVPVESATPLSEALRRANEAGARALVVVDADGEPRSLVREAAIVGVPEHRRPWVAVSGLAQDLTDGMRVSAELAGEELLDTLRATPATEYLVVEESGAIYGVLSAADVERAFVKAMARPS
ncbi:site-2 protease family protein [Streptomyces sp. NPDC056002]|uniref:site-2 protease family protein n=1 Tax=Streptomyces sp. NPDC056002 TaxID=3345675 RepID=UPI0035D6200D